MIKRPPMLLREYIAQTGQLPSGLELLRDTMDFKPLDVKRAITESFGHDKVNVMRCTGVFQRADQRNANGRIYPYPILKEAIEKLQTPIKERKVCGEFDHPCLTSPDFKVLTCDGWKKFEDIKEGDFVYSRVDGIMVKSRVNTIINEQYEGQAYKLEGRYINSGFTAPHKIIMETRNGYTPKQTEATLQEIYTDRKKFNKNIIPRKAKWVGNDQSTYIIPGIPKEELKALTENYYNAAITDDLHIDTKTFTSFLGLWLAEGCIVNEPRSYRVNIFQTKDDYKPIIREMLSKFPNGLKWQETDNSFYLSDARLHKYLSKLGNKYTKYIPEDIKALDAIYLEELVYWFQVGDGRLKNGRSNVFAVSEKLINDLHECYVKSGGCCYSTTIITENDYTFAGRVIKAENKKPLYQLTLSDMEGIHLDDRFLKIEPFQHKGNIYCLTTEHGNFYMEQDGCSFWTGNCDAKIHLDRISHLLTRLWMENKTKTVYGELEVINDDRCPCGSMLSCLLDRGIQVGISSRGVGDMELVEADGEEAYQVQEGFEFITFDAVAEPSVTGTQLKRLEESRKHRLGKISPIVSEDKKVFLHQARSKMLKEEIRHFLSL